MSRTVFTEDLLDVIFFTIFFDIVLYKSIFLGDTIVTLSGSLWISLDLLASLTTLKILGIFVACKLLIPLYPTLRILPLRSQTLRDYSVKLRDC